jgi:DNA-directed RNA polymerase subunit RPC12/RpoP
MGATLEHHPSVFSRCGTIHRLFSLFEPPGECMERQVDELPVVRCPGCNRPMDPQERASITERLVDIRYVCAGCGMETKRTIKEEA